MSAFRVAVEWSYKDVKAMWTTQDFKRKLKVRESPVAVLFIMSALLWNCKVCFRHGSQAGAKFQCEPPSLSHTREQSKYCKFADYYGNSLCMSADDRT
jgi:hypothetical protein